MANIEHITVNGDTYDIADPTARDNADSAANTATDAATAASNAQKSAETAQSSADAAQTAASSAQSSADKAQSSADNAQSSADAAQKTADGNSSDIKDIQDELDDLFPASGGSHNGIYRGKYLGNAVTDEQWNAISDGTFDDLYIGDYWTINGFDWVIADFDYWWRCGDSGNALAKHHVIIVPRNCLSINDTPMNPTNTTEGGYVGSQMYESGLDNAKEIINAAFGESHIVNHREYLTNAITDGRPSGGAWCDSTIELMNEQMVYGGPCKQQMPYGGTNITTNTIDTSQLAWFRLDRTAKVAMGNGTVGSTGTRYTYWLRDIVSATIFAYVSGTGGSADGGASSEYGVRPAFGICKS